MNENEFYQEILDELALLKDAQNRTNELLEHLINAIDAKKGRL